MIRNPVRSSSITGVRAVGSGSISRIRTMAGIARHSSKGSSNGRRSSGSLKNRLCWTAADSGPSSPVGPYAVGSPKFDKGFHAGVFSSYRARAGAAIGREEVMYEFEIECQFGSGPGLLQPIRQPARVYDAEQAAPPGKRTALLLPPQGEGHR